MILHCGGVNILLQVQPTFIVEKIIEVDVI